MDRWKPFAVLVGIVFLHTCAAQSLLLSSATGSEGGPLVLSLALNTPGDANLPAAVQWTFRYPRTLVSNFSVTPGPVLNAAHKTLTCNPNPDSYICVVAGETLDTIPSGVVAVASITLAASTAAAAIDVVNPVAASPSAQTLPLAATGNTASVPGALSCLLPILSWNNGLPCSVSLSDAGRTAGTILTRAWSALTAAVAAGMVTADIPFIWNERISDRQVTPGDSLMFTAAGIDCSGAPGTMRVEFGRETVPVRSWRAAPGRAGICEIDVTVPGSAAGDAVPLTLELTATNGIKKTSNTVAIRVVQRH